MKRPVHPLTRRRILHTALVAPAVLASERLIGAASGVRPVLAATPACDPAEPTPRQTAGPFFKPDSPERRSLVEPGLDGDRLVLLGVVLSTRCEPVAGARVDLWHADADGRYDTRGFRLRGHQYTDAAGRYGFETIVPGRYGPRTRHYHVEVWTPAGLSLVTQLYFPGEDRNAADFLFRPDLLMEVDEGRGGRLARFDFVLDLG